MWEIIKTNKNLSKKILTIPTRKEFYTLKIANVKVANLREGQKMKCKSCGFEAPVISRLLGEPEFIQSIDSNGYIEPILICPSCGKRND